MEDPLQVDAAIVHLIANLPSPGSDHRSTPSPRVYCNNVSENQDCSTPTTENSPTKPLYNALKLKTGSTKRPPSTDLGTNNVYKRQRISPQPTPMSNLPPYSTRTQIKTEVTVSSKTFFYCLIVFINLKLDYTILHCTKS